MRAARWFFALIGLSIGCALLLGPASADELVGKYQATGVTPKGKPYSGQVQIEQLGALHVVLWKLADGEAYKGIGIRQGDVLGVAYGPSNTKFGIVVYKIAGGTLTGAWADSRDLKSELGKETLQGDPNLTGVYNIALGQNRDGMTNYGGQVQITRNGESYLLIWAKPAAIGVGVRLNDMLVVAYTGTPQKMPGVVAYQASGADVLSGIWSIAGIKPGSAGGYDIAVPDKAGHEALKRLP
jgi:hypothetical protein